MGNSARFVVCPSIRTLPCPLVSNHTQCVPASTYAIGAFCGSFNILFINNRNRRAPLHASQAPSFGERASSLALTVLQAEKPSEAFAQILFIFLLLASPYTLVSIPSVVAGGPDLACVGTTASPRGQFDEWETRQPERDEALAFDHDSDDGDF